MYKSGTSLHEEEQGIQLFHSYGDALGQVVKAYDGCPAGIDGRCNHVAATLFAFEQYFKFHAGGAPYLVHQNHAIEIFHASARLIHVTYQFLTASL